MAPASSRSTSSTRRRLAERCGVAGESGAGSAGPACPIATFVAQDDRVAAPAGEAHDPGLPVRVEQLRREHISINGLRRQHVLKLANATVDDVRRRVQQEMTGDRGIRDDPLYRVCNILRAGEEHLTDRQQAWLRSVSPPATIRRGRLRLRPANSCLIQPKQPRRRTTPRRGRSHESADVPDPRTRPASPHAACSSSQAG